MSSALTFIPWILILISIAIGALNITSAINLLRERYTGSMLMLTGSGIALLGQLGQDAYAMAMQANDYFRANSNITTLAISSLTTLGALLFSIGLLLHTLHQRGMANRIAELEAILNSRNE